MTRYVGIDSGKFGTKVAEYLPDKDCVRKFTMRTKMGNGDLRDDALEDQTVIIKIGDQTYKVGNGARGNGANMDTDKKSEIHKICLLTGLAAIASTNEVDEICVASGLPATEWADVSKRLDFKDYIFPKGDVTVEILSRTSKEPQKKIFRIKEQFAFPESIGALFMDEVIGTLVNTDITGVIDIGNLNANLTLWQGQELVQEKSCTPELGGAILIQQLAQELSTGVTACDELVTANLLKLPSGQRQLPSGLNLTDEQIAESKQIIERVIRQHAEKIRNTCRARGWSLDVMRLLAIGGTSYDIRTELKAAFGNGLVILPESNYCNALGYLRMMCAKLPEIGKVIPLSETPGKNAKA